MPRPALLFLLALPACGALLGVESITIDESAPDAGTASPPPTAEAGAETAAPGPSACEPGATRACNTHPQDGVGPCKAGSQTCDASKTWSACTGDVGPLPETCDGNDRDCNGKPGIDEPAPPPPAGAMDCTHIFACNGPGRGALFFRTGIGFTSVAGANTEWTAFAPRGDFSDKTNPPGTLRISHDGTRMKLGPVTAKSACCPDSCPTANTFFDGQGQYYTLP